MTDEQEKLIMDNIKLAKWIANNYRSTGIEYEELFAMCMLGMVKAVNTFDPSRGKFISVARMIMENEIRMEIRKRKRKMKEVSLETFKDKQKGEEKAIWETIFHDEKTSNIDNNIVNSIVLKEAWKKLTEKEKQILIMRYFRDMKQREIAEELHISRSYACKLERNALDKLKKIIEEG